MMETKDYSKCILLTVKEASKHFGIGEHKIREVSADNDCTLYVGNKAMIKREKLEKCLNGLYSI